MFNNGSDLCNIPVQGLAFSFALDGMDQSGETYLAGRLQESNWTWPSFDAVAAAYIWGLHMGTL